jgi:hypothetical protein
MRAIRHWIVRLVRMEWKGVPKKWKISDFKNHSPNNVRRSLGHGFAFRGLPNLIAT